MHGYVALDADGELLVPFRTWRNNITGEACAELTPLLDFAVPQRWSIAHLYQSILDGQPHLARLAHLKTLAALRPLAADRRARGGPRTRRPGMFPIDPVTGDWDAARMATFDALIAPPEPGLDAARHPARRAARRRARPARSPPTARACSTRRARSRPASRCARPRATRAPAWWPRTPSGRGRATCPPGTSIFAMIVLEQSLSRVHEEIDIVVTPDGSPVAMAHSNNGTSDLDAWMSLFGQVGRALGADVTRRRALRPAPAARGGRATPDAGGLLAINYVSGEHMTGFTEGRPLFVRNQDAQAHPRELHARPCTSRRCARCAPASTSSPSEEGVVIEEIRGHGGFFKGGDTGQRMMAAALDVPVSIPATAGEGGAWGMAVLAAYMLRADADQSLPDYLDSRIAGSMGTADRPGSRATWPGSRRSSPATATGWRSSARRSSR